MGNSHLGDPDAEGSARISTYYRRETWIEGRAEEQLAQVAGWPGMKRIAAFPDLHPGRHGPVGAAFLADRIYPQLIGPDIGCGMALFRLDLPRRKLKIDKASRRLSVLEEGTGEAAAALALDEAGLSGRVSTYGLGTIGGGNHFCEVQAVEEILDEAHASRLGLEAGLLCLLVHTGSRNLGASIFTGIEETWRNGFDADSAEGQSYLDLHDRAVTWARLNRQMIAQSASEALRTECSLICDAPHNHVGQYEGLWLHRKGAARPDAGLAPLAGSRESLSYLLAADAIPHDALGSLSHGAGRRYDRASMHGRIKKTRSGLAAMSRNRFGGAVICESADLLIEEAGHAYKDVASVAADLEAFGVAKRIASLTPLITYKTSRSGGEA